jgi:hypothetical protein
MRTKAAPKLRLKAHARIGGWNCLETHTVVRINVPGNFDQKTSQSLAINLCIVRGCSFRKADWVDG